MPNPDNKELLGHYMREVWDEGNLDVTITVEEVLAEGGLIAFRSAPGTSRSPASTASTSTASKARPGAGPGPQLEAAWRMLQHLYGIHHAPDVRVRIPAQFRGWPGSTARDGQVSVVGSLPVMFSWGRIRLYSPRKVSTRVARSSALSMS